jgi:hypothetical protein
MYDHLFKQETMIDNSTVAKNIHEKGWSHAGRLKEDVAREFREYFDGCIWYNYHVKGHQVNPISDRRTAPSNCSSVAMQDVVLAPHWFEASLKMTDIVTEYFGTKNIVLYSYNIFYSNPAGPNYEGVQTWHRDHDSENFLALFVYLTDVLTIEDGAHAFEQKDGQRVDIFGPAGTMFFADTRQMHMGHKPRINARAMAWARWSLNPNPRTYEIDGLSPVDKNLLGDRYPKDAVIQNIIRKVVV